MSWLRQELRWPPLLGLIAAGVALRVATMALYFPAVLQFSDSVRFARAGPDWDGMFSDYWMPAGYAFFLRGLRLISDQVWLATSVQHLVGALVGVAVFLAIRRLDVPRWIALAIAAVYLLGGDVLYLEHLLMTDWLALDLTTLALCAAVFGLHPRVDLRWLAAAGALGAAGWLTRSPALAAILTIAGIAALAANGGRLRAQAAAVTLAGAACIFGGYLLAFELSGGGYLGLSDMRGWVLHARVAPFAECDRFDVPAGSEALCETTPPDQRQGPYSYAWNLDSVSLRNYRLGPGTDEPLWRFATAAIRAQPLDYAAAVASDLARYVRDPRPTERARDGLGRKVVSFGYRDRLNEGINAGWIDPVYDGLTVSAPGEDLLGGYQAIFRVNGVLIVALLFSSIAGLVWGRGPGRLGVALFGSTSMLLYLIPTATLGYDYRYGIPAATLLAVAGILGGHALWLRRSNPDREAGISASAP